MVDPTAKEVVIAARETIDRHILVISILVGKNIIDDAVIDCGSIVNIITEHE